MRIKPLILGSVLVLAGCAYAMDDSIQDVRFETPGALGATCLATVADVRYTIKPPQTLSLPKSRKDMMVDCLAPGNRRKQVYIEPGYQSSAGWNALNGGAGLAWDYASNALYRWPDIIEVNFTDSPPVPQPLPAQNNPDVIAPEGIPLEEFLPGRPRMNSDAYAQPEEIRKREAFVSPETSTSDDTQAFTEPARPSADKGDLKAAAPTPKKSTTSSKSAAPEAFGPPVPMFPGD